MSGPLLRPAPWRAPIDVLAALAETPFTLALLADGSARGRWSYIASNPRRRFDSLAALRRALTPRAPDPDQDHPPFQGGAAGLACYEWGAALEPAAPQARTAWPDLIGGVYDRLLAFDHHRRRAWIVAPDAPAADALERRLQANGPLPGQARAPSFVPRGSGEAHQASVAAVVDAIAAGEIFQANIARAWGGRLADEATPFAVLARLAQDSPAPFAGYLRLPGRAVVSNSPERFIQVSAQGRASTQPIKGTRPRGATPEQDRALAAQLQASAKDRAENLMIVDLMRNDLARACRPGSVAVPQFCALESYANVHHLVSTVTGALAAGKSALDLFAAAFPAGSITGAPKVQAMRVIARHEPPRGPYCGSLFWAGDDGAFDSSVLIRTLAFEQDAGGWRFETRAGGGIVADSDPQEEDAEAMAKIGAIRRALGH